MLGIDRKFTWNGRRGKKPKGRKKLDKLFSSQKLHAVQ